MDGKIEKHREFTFRTQGIREQGSAEQGGGWAAGYKGLNGMSMWGQSWARPCRNWNVRIRATSYSWLSCSLQRTHFWKCSFHCFLPTAHLFLLAIFIRLHQDFQTEIFHPLCYFLSGYPYSSLYLCVCFVCSFILLFIFWLFIYFYVPHRSEIIWH